ncbi:FidL-like protein [Rahnella aquatilis]|uniref:FidL-like protein n=1 Tax=Rahnella aquatilis TaxID=34038 RepID=UPI00031305B3|nr:FidL-like protein [Rahnella aquatilis]
MYDEKGNITQRKTLLRNIYYDYIHESTHSSTYSLTSSQINIDSVDNMDWQISSLLLLNSFFLTGHTDTLALKKYDDNTLLIESNQSPVALCVFKKIF